MEKLSRYDKLKSLGHRGNRDVFDGPVIIQEKIDGSQISFAVVDGELLVRSRKNMRDLDGKTCLFKSAVEHLKSVKENLEEGYIYRGEFLQSKGHNLLTYDRVPEGHIVLFDIFDTDLERCVNRPHILISEADLLGIETAPVLFEGEVKDKEQLEELMDQESFLGGPKMEGIVIKNYRNGQRAKMVNPVFQEKHNSKKVSKKMKGFERVAEPYITEARWRKAVQHLREEGELVGEPRDIGKLVREVQADTFEECEEQIKEELFEAYRKNIASYLVKGFAQWYKELIKEDARI